jgi:hypothetical protein
LLGNDKFCRNPIFIFAWMKMNKVHILINLTNSRNLRDSRHIRQLLLSMTLSSTVHKVFGVWFFDVLGFYYLRQIEYMELVTPFNLFLALHSLHNLSASQRHPFF